GAGSPDEELVRSEAIANGPRADARRLHRDTEIRVEGGDLVHLAAADVHVVGDRVRELRPDRADLAPNAAEVAEQVGPFPRKPLQQRGQAEDVDLAILGAPGRLCPPPSGHTASKARKGSTMAERVADFVLNRLREWGIHRIYGYPGDAINGFLGALERAEGDPEFIQARHEEMAAFMACGHAKFTEEVGVCLATSGPGAIHLLN